MEVGWEVLPPYSGSLAVAAVGQLGFVLTYAQTFPLLLNPAALLITSLHYAVGQRLNLAQI